MGNWLDKTIDLRTLLELFGALVALYSLVKNFRQNKAIRAARGRLLNQRAAEDFHDMASTSASLETMIRSRQWPRAAELAIELRGSLTRAYGYWSKLLLGEESANLLATAEQVKSLLDSFPLDEREVNDEELLRMTTVCDVLILAVNPIAGRLKYIDQMEEESWLPNRKGSFLNRMDQNISSLFKR